MELTEILTAAISTGCGAFIAWWMDRIIEWREDDAKPISPKTRRRVALLLCAVVPSVAYGLLAVLVGEYNWEEHLMAVGLAFTTSQWIHGERRLETGGEVINRALDEAGGR